MSDDGLPDDSEPVELPIDGTLDLHLFRPKDVKALVPHYLRLCREKGLLDVKIIHGKGTGALRAHVQAILSRMSEVQWYRTAEEANGGWGATLVRLLPRPPA
jgi:DNA-nicking Smr family endonuclease